MSSLIFLSPIIWRSDSSRPMSRTPMTASAAGLTRSIWPPKSMNIAWKPSHDFWPKCSAIQPHNYLTQHLSSPINISSPKKSIARQGRTAKGTIPWVSGSSTPGLANANPRVVRQKAVLAPLSIFFAVRISGNRHPVPYLMLHPSEGRSGFQISRHTLASG